MQNSQEHKFDELLRESLSHAADERRPVGWDQLSSRLSSGQESFDQAIREKFNSFDTELTPMGWDQLEQRIDHQRAASADKHVKDQLAHVSGQSQSGGWAALAARLELIAHRRQSLAAFKLTEVSLMLSILLLFWRFGVLPGSEEVPVAQVSTQELATATASIDMDEHPSVELASTDQVSEVRTSAGQQASGLSLNVLPSFDIGNSQVTRSESLVGSSGQNSVAAIEKLPARELQVIDANQPGVPQIDIAENSAGASEVLMRDILPLQNALTSASFGLLPSIQDTDPDKGIHTYLRVFYSPVDFNQVITPQNEFLDRIIEADNRFTIGQSGGILIDIASRHFSLNTGLIYGLRSYIPTLLKVDQFEEDLPLVIAPSRSGYSRLSFHTASIPLTINKTLLNNDNWRITLGGGVGLTMVLKSSFVKLDGADQVLNDLLNSQVVPQGRGGIQERVDAKEYFNPEPGWFQGGSIFSNANFYLTGTASFERKLGDRFSVFAAPTISRYLHFVQKGGLGPNYDRIHNHSVYFGTRIRLGTVD
ncbi:MAG: hypothetical protein AAFP08_08005 [Bacteroidota bacterium]